MVVNISLSPDLEAFSSLRIAFWSDSRSASNNSVSTVSKSTTGSILSWTWVISEFSKHLTTWIIAWVSRICDKNLLPKPSPSEAPLTKPAISTNSVVVGITFSGLTISAIFINLWSGTGTMPLFGSIVQKGKFWASMPAAVNALKRVDLPTLGRPTTVSYTHLTLPTTPYV